jgi:hypothetical protein
MQESEKKGKSYESIDEIRQGDVVILKSNRELCTVYFVKKKNGVLALHGQNWFVHPNIPWEAVIRGKIPPNIEPAKEYQSKDAVKEGDIVRHKVERKRNWHIVKSVPNENGIMDLYGPKGEKRKAHWREVLKLIEESP